MKPETEAAPSSSLPSLFGGAALGIVLVFAFDARIALTWSAAEMAASDSPNRIARRVSLLRHFGSRDELLRMCYGESQNRNFGMFPSGRPMLSANSGVRFRRPTPGKCFSASRGCLTMRCRVRAAPTDRGSMISSSISIAISAAKRWPGASAGFR